MMRNVTMLVSNLLLAGFIKEGIFCSMLYILFSPVAMKVYLFTFYGFILARALYKTIKTYT